MSLDDPRSMPDYEDYDDDPGECWNCGGEGFVWDCFDGFCVNAEDGCEDCTRPCPEHIPDDLEHEKDGKVRLKECTC